MKIHEYQAKALFRQFHIPTPRGEFASNVKEAVAAAEKLGGDGPWVVKAQIHAGGRGKGGGILLAKNKDEVAAHAQTILGRPLVTPQTGSSGRKVTKLLVEEGLNIAKEFYLAVVLDRSKNALAVMASQEGGMEIEEVAAKSPDKIIRAHVDPTVGWLPYHGRLLSAGLGLDRDKAKAFTQVARQLVELFLAKDASLVEINPLVLTKGDGWVALDAKINFDDSALFRHADLSDLHDPEEEDPRDREAARWDLNYIQLDGNIGCLVNGAGLAMATMDIIKQAGGEPANFLDVGGGASEEMVREAFKLLVSEGKVKGILVNIFGGILRCDVLAKGIASAAREINLKVPLVVYLEGTNVEAGRHILSESGLNIETASNMAEGAKMVVAAARRAQ